MCGGGFQCRRDRLVSLLGNCVWGQLLSKSDICSFVVVSGVWSRPYPRAELLLLIDVQLLMCVHPSLGCCCH